MINRLLLLALVLMLAGVSPSYSQTKMWEWSKQLGISVKTDWDAAHVDNDGNFYFAGTSEKFTGGKPPRATVISKWNADTTIQWNTQYIGGTGTAMSDLGVDDDGNVIAIVKFSGKLTRPDGTEMSHFLDAFALIKLDKDGKEIWSKRLTISGYSAFTVFPNGMIAMRADGGSSGFFFGDSTVASTSFAEHLLLISPDGGLRSSINLNASIPQPFQLKHVQFLTETKGIVLNYFGNFAPVYLVRGEVDMTTGSYQAQDTITISINSSSSINVVDAVHESNGKTTLLMTASNNATLNGTLELKAQTTNQMMEGYIIQTNASFEPINSTMVSNPIGIEVRDTQVVLTAKYNTSIGFVNDLVAIDPTGNMPGHIIYIMNRDLQYRRHATVQPQSEGSVPEATLIDEDGGVYVMMESNYDIRFDQRFYDAPSHSDASIIILAKVAVSSKAGVTDATPLKEHSIVYPHPASSVLYVQLAAPTSYRLIDALGRVVASGSTLGQIDVSMLTAGSYILSLDTDTGVSTTSVRITR